MEVTIVVGEDKLRAMLVDLDKAKKMGDHSILVEYESINFQVYAMESKQLKEFNAKHPT